MKAFKKVREELVTAVLEELAQEHETAARSYRLVCVAGVVAVREPAGIRAVAQGAGGARRRGRRGFRNRRWKRWRSSPTGSRSRGRRSSRCAAWPWTAVMQTLLERGLVEQVGRAEVVGPADDLRHDGVVPGIFRIAQPGGFAGGG